MEVLIYLKDKGIILRSSDIVCVRTSPSILFVKVYLRTGDSVHIDCGTRSDVDSTMTIIWELMNNETREK